MCIAQSARFEPSLSFLSASLHPYLPCAMPPTNLRLVMDLKDCSVEKSLIVHVHFCSPSRSMYTWLTLQTQCKPQARSQHYSLFQIEHPTPLLQALSAMLSTRPTPCCFQFPVPTLLPAEHHHCTHHQTPPTLSAFLIELPTSHCAMPPTNLRLVMDLKDYSVEKLDRSALQPQCRPSAQLCMCIVQSAKFEPSLSFLFSIKHSIR
jgi:hypothetical protein